MARSNKNLPSFSNVSAGSTASLQVPLGFTYNAIHIKYSGVTLAQLKDITVNVDGKPIQTFVDGVRLQDINKYWKRNIKNGILTIWFDRPEMDNNALRRAFGLGTADISTLDIEIEIDGAATDPKLTAHAVRSNNLPLGGITKIKKFSAAASTAGIKEIDNLPPESMIAAIHLFKPDISKAELEMTDHMGNTNVWSDFDKTLAAGMQVDYGRNPDTSKMTTVEFVHEGDPLQALLVQGAQDLRLRAHCDSPGAFDIVVEYFSGLKGI